MNVQLRACEKKVHNARTTPASDSNVSAFGASPSVTSTDGTDGRVASAVMHEGKQAATTSRERDIKV